MSSRDEVLRRVREAIGAAPHEPPAERTYTTTSTLSDAEVVDRFADRVDDYRATVHRTDPSGIAAVLAGIVGDRERIGVPAGLPAAWLGDLTVHRDDGSWTTADLDRLEVVVTGCATAIGETGTIVLDGSADQGRRALTLVPDHHVCIVTADRIVATVPQGVAQLDPGRALTMISGPSATSDIELDRVEGVHGPRVLDVIIVTDPPGRG